MNPLRTRAGAALLEVLCALAIVSIAGLSAMDALRAALGSMRDANTAENELEAAGRVLVALTLLSGKELTQRLGRHALGEFDVDVQRPEPALFRVALVSRVPSSRELLVTVAYRPVITQR
jgi:type II secretory pathway pseudopilin PulG